MHVVFVTIVSFITFIWTNLKAGALSALALWSVGWLVGLGLTAFLDNISVYIGPSPKEREKEERKER